MIQILHTYTTYRSSKYLSTTIDYLDYLGRSCLCNTQFFCPSPAHISDYQGRNIFFTFLEMVKNIQCQFHFMFILLKILICILPHLEIVSQNVFQRIMPQSLTPMHIEILWQRCLKIPLFEPKALKNNSILSQHFSHYTKSYRHYYGFIIAQILSTSP